MNFGTPVPLLIGIVLILGAVALFFLDKLKPGYGRDSDKVYAVLWLISGVFLLGHLTMELLASFQQLMMAGMLIAVTIENVLSRTPKGEASYSASAANGRGREDYYRPSRPQPAPSSRMNVRAELDEEPYGDRYARDRRMLSGRDVADRSGGYYREEYPTRYPDTQSDYRDRSPDRGDRSPERLAPGSDRIRRRRPKSYEPRYGTGSYGVSDDAPPPETTWNSATGSYSSGPSGYSSHSNPTPQDNSYTNSPRNGDTYRTDDSYVDYRPVDYPANPSEPTSSEYGATSSEYGDRY